VRSFVGPAQTARNRPQGTVLSFLADNVPAVGYRRYDLVTGSGPAPRDVEALENEHYSLELDIEGGYGLEVVDRELDLDLVADGDFGLGQIVHDRYEGPLRATMRLPPGGAPATGGGRPSRGALIGSRTVPRQGVVVERTGNELEDRVTVRLAGPGFEWIETTYRLLHGVRRLDVTHRFSKRATLAKESVYVVFPFALRDPSVDYELTGGVGGHASVPGSAEHFHAIRHWVALQDETATVAWSTLEAPLVQLGNIFLPYPPYPPTIDSPGGGTVVSWAMNNVWDTNFPPSQGGETALSYAIASAPAAADARALGIATAAALTHPLIGVLGGEASTPAGGLCELDRDDVELVMLAQSTRGHDFVVHLQSYASREVTVRIGFPGLHVARVLAGTSGERDLREAPDALVHMGPGDYATVAVDLERRGT